jgi:hypothetical protein
MRGVVLLLMTWMYYLREVKWLREEEVEAVGRWGAQLKIVRQSENVENYPLGWESVLVWCVVFPRCYK